MRNEDIISKQCECSYGKPSGHAKSAVFIYLLFIIKYPNMSIIKKIFSIFILFNIIISRAYFGQHSLNQLILGAIYGFIILSTLQNLRRVPLLVINYCVVNRKGLFHSQVGFF